MFRIFRIRYNAGIYIYLSHKAGRQHWTYKEEESWTAALDSTVERVTRRPASAEAGLPNGQCPRRDIIHEGMLFMRRSVVNCRCLLFSRA